MSNWQFVPLLCVHNVTADTSCHLWVMISNNMRANTHSLTQATGIVRFPTTGSTGEGAFTSKLLCCDANHHQRLSVFCKSYEHVASSLAYSAGWEHKWKGQDVWVGSMHLGTKNLYCYICCVEILRHNSQSWPLYSSFWAVFTPTQCL